MIGLRYPSTCNHPVGVSGFAVVNDIGVFVSNLESVKNIYTNI